ncbi:regulating synaptic membrane exocytosis protein 1 isoform X1 [Apis laboriosa]|uniref:regulating synaptic membrane exocytosis protein 1 isoform X1 n=1 Tax=Apis dorsata TaxID=7462 RepID=UPI0003DF4E85|nr:regulating synaptic membrane exocytosis protein 1 isoform X1 [Apis dorsata]XP_006608315.1 regulating synaptic membrane exocytosis protein 1 isoform X1 [Apis dorsata]XP_006608316.1 regulating synaptic membrane exocytosis protein 1 isoform X1 [Apis dorsata]XP_031367761.1 regulating synaptic membrane exocytosis protein 1 isoform X1 [Apis dorsata]XP_043794116.1 regulating synaptic membrane exocytosis protein 1 isoform X1 [Apis laboriosa]XP_043794117.1 regulating synaptic membrane exocytosis pro
MLPANVVSFVKKMVTTQPDSGTTGSVTPDEGGTTFSKWRQLGSGVIRDVTKFGPAKVTPVEETQPKEETTTESTKTKSKTGDDCRVCRKSFAPEEASRICCECQHKVCEDCACYSTTTNSDDPSSWRCSVCRRKLASRDQPIVTQESTDSLLEVPVLEALQRRHSDARLGCQSGSQIGGLGSGLAPPRSPELRRHSDVSPASLKELEKFRKVAGERREELRWELDRSIRSRATSPDRHQVDKGRATSPQRVSVVPSSVAGEPSDVPLDGDEEDERRRHVRRSGTVRKSRMTRQRSYDDEMKNVAAMSGGGAQHAHPEPGLGLPVQLPRRASAYDVYATPGAGGLNAMAIAAAQQRASISAQGGRKPPEERPATRRLSFRVVKPYEVGAEDESMMNLEASSVPVVSPKVVPPPVLGPDEERRTRRRGSQLPDINAIKGLASSASSAATKVAPPSAVNRVAAEDRELARQGSLVDGESIKIVIHHADNDMTPWVNAKRRIKLRRDPSLDKGHRTAGFGLRVVGGKTGTDGRTFAYVMWTLPDGPAAKVGIQRGDKVLEWNGVSLVDRSFEEVVQITERNDDVVDLVVEHVADTGDLPEDLAAVPSGKVPGNLGLLMEGETDKTPSSPTRRKLPKTPEQIAKEKQVTGRIQIQVSYEADRKELIVSVFMADDLCAREDTGYGTLPEAYAKLALVPIGADQITLKTVVAEPSQKPIWNATLLFSGVDGESLMKRAIEVTLWDFCPDGDNVFLGECTVDLERALENDRAVWYRLEDPRGLRASKSPYCSPRGSLSMEIAQRLLRKTELRERSYSDDTQSDSGSPELCFLHPDHAWHANSRRGSSQSEQLEVEPYELNRDYSRSLPGSRRSSFQSQGGTDSKRGSMGETEMPTIHFNRDRRRSSFTRPMRDPEEILEGLRSLKAAKRELGRTMSLSGDKRRESRRGERKDSVMNIPERFYDRNSESDEEEKWSQPTRNENGVNAKLGRGQVPPKGFKITAGGQSGEVKLGLCLSKGTLEVEVICARDICPGEKEEPDTYVKTYLRDGDRWLQKRKTRVVRHSRNPQYRQTIKYSSCDALGRNLLVMLWEKKQAFESNQGLGGAEVSLDLLPLAQLTVDWYPLFPIHTLGTHTADSP